MNTKRICFKIPALFLKCPENVFSVFISNEFIMFYFYSCSRPSPPPPPLAFSSLESFKKQVNGKSIKIVCVIIRFWMIVITQKGYSTEQFMMMNKLLLQSCFTLFIFISLSGFFRNIWAEEKPFCSEWENLSEGTLKGWKCQGLRTMNFRSDITFKSTSLSLIILIC